MTSAFLSGFQLSLALILVIGPQNAFVLRQGLRREHVWAVVLFCALSDAVLMAVGVAGLATASSVVPALQTVLRLGGATFLVWYGARSLYAAWRGGQALDPASGTGSTLGRVIGSVAVLTWANPHVWLDTVVLVGSVAAQFEGRALAFWAGAATSSLVFFSVLGFGARVLAPVFAAPLAWRILDAGVGMLMLGLAVKIAMG